MCGIIALLSLSNNNVIDILLAGLKQLQNRGYDSAGVCTMNKEFSMLKYASTSKLDSIKQLENEKLNILNSNIGIAHTRWATHGAKTDENSHPHISYDNKISLVHNGIIENYSELKIMLQNEGIEFKSHTDTEVIVNLLAFNNKDSDNFVDTIKKTLKMMSGTWGLAIMDLDNPDKLFCVRHGSPLLVGQTDDMVLVSSEQSGFHGLVSNYFILDSNDICIITKNDNKIHIDTNKKYDLYDTLSTNFDLSPTPYPYWTIKEINEQFDASLRAISLSGRLLEDDKVNLGGLEENKEVLKRIDNLIFLACGTSYHAALCGIHYFKDLCNFNTIQIVDGAEFTEKDIPKFGNTALVMLSQSGETKDLHRCIDIGKDNDLFIIGVINVVDSMIARESNCGCYLNAGREVGVASTKSFTNQVILLSMMAVWFSQIHDKNSNKRRNYIECLRKLPYDIKKTIESSNENKDMIVDLLNKPSLFVLGKGKGEAIAREGALKIKEITYIHAEGYSGSALKHGPFALLDENLPVILIAPLNEHYAKMNNAYEEIKSRYAPILFITDDDKCSYENKVIVPNNKIFCDLLSVIPLQIAAYYLSIERGLNPDLPKNLAKCVTVE
jgi:glutamine---fructose-6-phosphate transaminase (isomerizing)